MDRFVAGLPGRAARGYQYGLLAAAPAAVIASAAAAVSGWPSPLEATAEQLMVWTPVGVANVLLLHAGSLARPLALLGALAVTMLAAGVAGAVNGVMLCTRRQRFVGFILAAAWLCAVFLWLIRPSEAAPEVWLVGSYLVVLAFISNSPALNPGRRAFLARTGLIVGGAALLMTVFSVRPLFRALAARRLFVFKRPRGLAIQGLAELVTTPANFYIMDKVLQYPEIGPPAWRLTVTGAVGRQLALDYGSLLARRSVHRFVTMECVDNPVGGSLISTALWTGIPVADLLHEAGATGDTIVFHSADQYTESYGRAKIEAAGGLIAYAMNGEVLRREHGYPARFLLPGHYGFKSVKWLERIEAVHGGYTDDWQSHGWTTEAVVHPTTRIDVARRTGNEILLAGVAFAGNHGVAAVEVRVNGGAWRRATLGTSLSRQSWRQWVVRLRGEGPAHVEVRVIDGDNMVQTGRVHGSYPDGATGWASVSV